MRPTIMALGAIHQAWCAGEDIISVNLGESFMVAGGNVEGLLEIYFFKPFSRLDARFTMATHPQHFFKEGPSLTLQLRPDYFQSWSNNLAGSCFLPMYLISSTWHHKPLMGTRTLLLRGR
jgi:hypothetical protein